MKERFFDLWRVWLILLLSFLAIGLAYSRITASQALAGELSVIEAERDEVKARVSGVRRRVEQAEAGDLDDGNLEAFRSRYERAEDLINEVLEMERVLRADLDGKDVDSDEVKQAKERFEQIHQHTAYSSLWLLNDNQTLSLTGLGVESAQGELPFILTITDEDGSIVGVVDGLISTQDEQIVESEVYYRGSVAYPADKNNQFEGGFGGGE